MSFSSLSEYISSLGDKEKEYILRFINLMENEYPNLKLRFSFSMPMWWFKDKMRDGYVGVSATKSRFTLHVSSESYVKEIEKERPELKYGKQCVSISYKREDDFLFLQKKAKEFISITVDQSCGGFLLALSSAVTSIRSLTFFFISSICTIK